MNLPEPGSFIELPAHEITQPGVHAELGVEHHDPREAVRRCPLLKLPPQPLEQAVPVDLAAGLVAPLGTNLVLDLAVEQMGQLPVVADQDDAPRRECHRHEQVQRIGPSGLVDDHAAELQALHGWSVRLVGLEQTHVSAGSLLAGRTDDAAVGLHGPIHLIWIGAQRIPITGQHAVDTVARFAHLVRQFGLQSLQQATRLIVQPMTLHDGAPVGLQAVDQRIAQAGQGFQQCRIGYSVHIARLQQQRLIRHGQQPCLVSQQTEHLVRLGRAVIPKGHGLTAQRPHPPQQHPAACRRQRLRHLRRLRRLLPIVVPVGLPRGAGPYAQTAECRETGIEILQCPLTQPRLHPQQQQAMHLPIQFHQQGCRRVGLLHLLHSGGHRLLLALTPSTHRVELVTTASRSPHLDRRQAIDLGPLQRVFHRVVLEARHQHIVRDELPLVEFGQAPLQRGDHLGLAGPGRADDQRDVRGVQSHANGFLLLRRGLSGAKALACIRRQGGQYRWPLGRRRHILKQRPQGLHACTRVDGSPSTQTPLMLGPMTCQRQIHVPTRWRRGSRLSSDDKAITLPLRLAPEDPTPIAVLQVGVVIAVPVRRLVIQLDLIIVRRQVLPTITERIQRIRLNRQAPSPSFIAGGYAGGVGQRLQLGRPRDFAHPLLLAVETPQFQIRAKRRDRRVQQEPLGWLLRLNPGAGVHKPNRARHDDAGIVLARPVLRRALDPENLLVIALQVESKAPSDQLHRPDVTPLPRTHEHAAQRLIARHRADKLIGQPLHRRGDDRLVDARLLVQAVRHPLIDTNLEYRFRRDGLHRHQTAQTDPRRLASLTLGLRQHPQRVAVLGMQQQRSGIRRWFDFGDPAILPKQQPVIPLSRTHHDFALSLPSRPIEITTGDTGAVNDLGHQG